MTATALTAEGRVQIDETIILGTPAQQAEAERFRKLAGIKGERDRRLEADFLFNGVLFQRDKDSLARITGAGTLAGLYLGAGGDPTSLKWHATPDNPTPSDFMWIASDDTLVPMDAQTVFSFARTAASVETAIIFAAKQLREMDPIPDDFKDDKWWP